LIRVAHPKFRTQLLNDVRKHYWVPEYQENTPTSVPELGSVEFKKFVFGDTEYVLRPLCPADERKLQEFFYSHNKETLVLRYSHHITQMSREKSCTLVSVDQHKDLALCFTERDNSGDTIQAVGRYYFIESDNSCESAFVIKESKRGKGMAKTLLSEMIKIARIRKLNRMFALVRSDNKPMIKVFENSGFTRKPGEDFQEIHLELLLNENNRAAE
jgi:RimJ/RimL family protein N-acetyltransferase